MKTNRESQSNANLKPGLKIVCVDFCRNILRQLKQAREAIRAEYRSLLAGQEHLLHLALNEAEALAFETEFPHLVFPVLAQEKVAGIANWQRRQRRVPFRGEFAFAA